jgi:hypothetical protein
MTVGIFGVVFSGVAGAASFIFMIALQAGLWPSFRGGIIALLFPVSVLRSMPTRQKKLRSTWMRLTGWCARCAPGTSPSPSPVGRQMADPLGGGRMTSPS